jgi:5'-nucleotidase
VLAHSGAFAKFVGRLDLIVSNEKTDFPGTYDPAQGFEVLAKEYTLFPVTDQTPEDPVVTQLLEPYAQQLEGLSNLQLLVGYAQAGSKRTSTNSGDSALGNLISTAMWLRLGIQTDFSLTNTTGIRADLVPGPVNVEEMYNIFPFDNTISKMQLSGTEVQELFDFVAQRSTGRGCVSQVQIAGARIVLDCKQTAVGQTDPGVAVGIYMGAYEPKIHCQHDQDCPPCDPKASNTGCGAGECKDPNGKCVAEKPGICDPNYGICWQPIDPFAGYELATSNYLAAGGSGFVVLQRNTTQHDTGVEQRDALVDYIRGGAPCGADQTTHKLKSCTVDTECDTVGGYVCACPEAVSEGDICTTTGKCAAGSCVLAQCRDDIAAIQRETCIGPDGKPIQTCLDSLKPCASGGEQCKYLACVDNHLGNFEDGRIQMRGQ